MADYFIVEWSVPYIELTFSKYLIVYDLDGNYIKTLDLDFTVHTIAYHAKTNRLYLSTDGEPQFCYLNLSELKL